MSVVGVDYFYLTAKGARTLEDLKEDGLTTREAVSDARRKGDAVKCVMVRDTTVTKCEFAHVVPFKGTEEDDGKFVADLVAEDVAWMGPVRVIVKADNEPALQALAVASLRQIRIDASEDLQSVSKEEPMTYESQSAGGVEVGVRNFRGMYRTLRSCLEARFGKKLPINHPLSAWLGLGNGATGSSLGSRDSKLFVSHIKRTAG